MLEQICMHRSSQDVRSCVEQLQTIEKEMRTLDTAQKELADIRDQLERKKSDKSGLVNQREVGVFLPRCLSSVNVHLL